MMRELQLRAGRYGQDRLRACGAAAVCNRPCSSVRHPCCLLGRPVLDSDYSLDIQLRTAHAPAVHHLCCGGGDCLIPGWGPRGPAKPVCARRTLAAVFGVVLSACCKHQCLEGLATSRLARSRLLQSKMNTVFHPSWSLSQGCTDRPLPPSMRGHHHQRLLATTG